MSRPSNLLTLDYFSGLLNAKVSSLESLNGGRNSRTFKVTAEDGSLYAAKLYPGPTADGRDRLAVEFTALEFLHQKGVKSVAKPVIADPAHQCALYEFVEGAQIDYSQVTTKDIDQTTQFLQRLNELKNDLAATRLPNAAEACFSVQEIIFNVQSRLNLLRNVEGSSRWFGVLKEFLDTEFLQAFNQNIARCDEQLKVAGTTSDSELNCSDRTLSPSDFGFHNCLRRRDGSLVFFDFEYFGWDDPAKMICDFLLHPAMDLSDFLKRRFLENLISPPNPDRALLERVKTAYPLFGLKWCLIFLNPFLAKYRLQRGINDLPQREQDDLLQRQLDKAKLMLYNIETAYEGFPYGDGRYACNIG